MSGTLVAGLPAGASALGGIAVASDSTILRFGSKSYTDSRTKQSREEKRRGETRMEALQAELLHK